MQGGEGEKRDGGKSESEDAALRARLDRLSKALEAQRQAQPSQSESNAGLSAGSLGSAMNLGFRVLAEFVAAIVVGTLIGWQIDVWFGTGPVFLIVFLVLGTAAGFLNVYRIAVGQSTTGRVK